VVLQNVPFLIAVELSSAHQMASKSVTVVAGNFVGALLIIHRGAIRLPQSWRQQLQSVLADSPLRALWNLRGVSLRDIAVRTWKAILQDHIFGHAAELGFYFLFALFPTLFCAGSILGFALRSAQQVPAKLIQVLVLVIPSGAIGTVFATFNQAAAAASSGKITFGFIVAIWSASVGVSAIQEVLSMVYRIEDTRSYLSARISAIGLTILLTFLGVLCLACMVGGDLGATLVFHQVPQHVFAGIYASSIRFMAWFAASCLLALSFAVIYYWAPDRKPRRWHWLTPGIGFGLIGWLVASLGFRAYLYFFKSYTATYGSLGAAIILLTWFYLCGLMLLVGAEIDAVIEACTKTPPSTGSSDQSSQIAA
jgi:membrane protein